MDNLDFSRPLHVHFIGIGGISMSGLAQILIDRGFYVSGSDRAPCDLTEHLSKEGALIFYPQKAENIPADCDLVVYTAAIHPDNPEFAEAKRLKLPMLSRAEFLGILMQNYASSVAVSGTHGKTTCTSMITHILMSCDSDPTVSVGGILPIIGGNIRVGGDQVFLTEACEYTNSFLHFHPTVGIILNVEEDHLDFFKDLADIRNSFKKFAHLLPKDGCLIINNDITNLDFFTEGLECDVLTYSHKSTADVTCKNISYDKLGCGTFDVFYREESLGSFHLNVPGEHNISNALASIACGIHLGLDISKIKEGLSSFTGTNRRFQYKGKIKAATLIDDYAHHPTEIRATLSTARNYPHGEIWCVFQPHTFSRTKAFLDDFARVLCLADHVILADVYAAREINTFGITSFDLSERINQLGGKSIYLNSFEKIETYLWDNIKEEDLVLTVGAGDVYLIGDALLEKEKEK